MHKWHFTFICIKTFFSSGGRKKPFSAAQCGITAGIAFKGPQSFPSEKSKFVFSITNRGNESCVLLLQKLLKDQMPEGLL